MRSEINCELERCCLVIRYRRIGESLFIPDFGLDDAGDLCCDIKLSETPNESPSDMKCTEVFYKGATLISLHIIMCGS